jgi:hypothetical protein
MPDYRTIAAEPTVTTTARVEYRARSAEGASAVLRPRTQEPRGISGAAAG